MGKSVMAVFGSSDSGSDSGSGASGASGSSGASDDSGDNSSNNFILCLPIASLIASILMFSLCQFRTMANLGKNVSMLSLLALFIVLIHCLFHHRYQNQNQNQYQYQYQNYTDDVEDAMMEQEQEELITTYSWNKKFSSLAGIGFAVGSNKLFLNIRHELDDRSQGSKVLAGSLTLYGFVYIIVTLLAGPGTLIYVKRS
jgi:hypothetical protein